MTSIELANQIRIESLKMVHRAGASHIGGNLSQADILAVLYSGILNVDPAEAKHPNRDRFILSKGWCAASLYAVLAIKGFFPVEELQTFCGDGSMLMGAANHHVPGVEFSTGSVGHGLSIGCGLALSGKKKNLPYRVVVLMSDGGMQEGSVWEAVQFAGHHKLDNLTLIIDENGLQAMGKTNDISSLHRLGPRLHDFGWTAERVDGHDHDYLEAALSRRPDLKTPLCLMAQTVKGKGVSFMENDVAWHYKCPNAEQLAQALKEVAA